MVSDTLRKSGKRWSNPLPLLSVLSVVFCVYCVYCVLFTAKSVFKKKKHPWHDSVSRRCSSEATERTGLSVIWHTVKDPRNLHSDCVPVGRAELCRSLAMLPLARIPKLASALAQGAGGGPGQRVHCGRLPSLPPSQRTAAYTLACLHTLQREISSTFMS